MSQPIASCALTEPEEEKNHLHLYASYLEVVRRGKSKKYALTPILRLEINHRQLLGPLIGGGVLSCIAFITLFSWNHWAVLLLVLGIGGIGLMYYGLVGVHVLTLKEDKIRYDVVLPGVSSPLPFFVRFYNHLIPRMALGPSHVFPVYVTTHASGKEPSFIYLHRPAEGKEGTGYIVADLMKLSMPLHFEFNKAGAYRAKIDEPIPDEAVIASDNG
jgi:hypothetical protein